MRARVAAAGSTNSPRLAREVEVSLVSTSLRFGAATDPRRWREHAESRSAKPDCKAFFSQTLNPPTRFSRIEASLEGPTTSRATTKKQRVILRAPRQNSPTLGNHRIMPEGSLSRPREPPTRFFKYWIGSPVLSTSRNDHEKTAGADDITLKNAPTLISTTLGLLKIAPFNRRKAL
jgi:hypothetical protein